MHYSDERVKLVVSRRGPVQQISHRIRKKSVAAGDLIYIITTQLKTKFTTRNQGCPHSTNTPHSKL